MLCGCAQYTSRAAQLYKTALEKDLAKVNANAMACPTSPTAAQAAKQGLDLLADSVRAPQPSPSPYSSRRSVHLCTYVFCHLICATYRAREHPFMQRVLFARSSAMTPFCHELAEVRFLYGTAWRCHLQVDPKATSGDVFGSSRPSEGAAHSTAAATAASSEAEDTETVSSVNGGS